MANKEIDYPRFKDNIDEMINLLEYDGMRSPGKTKMNAQTLCYLHELKGIYSKKKQTPKKED